MTHGTKILATLSEELQELFARRRQRGRCSSRFPQLKTVAAGLINRNDGDIFLLVNVLLDHNHWSTGFGCRVLGTEFVISRNPVSDPDYQCQRYDLRDPGCNPLRRVLRTIVAECESAQNLNPA